ncbi:MAG: hypothetical protein FJX72_00890 [Armatimonadetes bacterium]|nr:hypothetical protein [Armatimonadota bacterium]
MSAAEPTIEETRAAIDRLVADRRASYLWFVQRGYQPANDRERLSLLGSLEARADRETYIATRELRDWLLRLSSEM